MKPTALPSNVSPLAPALAGKIVEMIRRDWLPEGHRLTEQVLCDELGVSRSPVRKALQYLAATGVVRSEPNKGFQVAKSSKDLGSMVLPEAADSDEAVYMQIADDRVAEKLGTDIAETDLMQRYGSTRTQIQRVLNRMSREGVVERKAGRGWVFLPLMSTAESYRESYRFRMIIEPAAIIEPGYEVDLVELDKCYREQVELLSGGIEKWTRSELFRPGVHLHETIIAGSGNRLLLDALRKVNQLRRLMEYRSKLDRSHMRLQCEEHLVLIDLLRRNERVEASHFLREHLNGAKTRKAGPDSKAGAKLKRA
ncbi:transcriptional regulator [Polaromonas sp. CF318]|uniref:GntR family transcriptional regulator n=1 Tax=Polaromonas sp. CF318 TaxID=1144318 RepID=UPI0002711F97|nr:GntR family transcriptional regulator [Polaromonas sp. CF318]EJL77862.1 transcriptional regulator [Polaromonas sp. CF318]